MKNITRLPTLQSWIPTVPSNCGVNSPIKLKPPSTSYEHREETIVSQLTMIFTTTKMIGTRHRLPPWAQKSLPSKIPTTEKQGNHTTPMHVHWVSNRALPPHAFSRSTHGRQRIHRNLPPVSCSLQDAHYLQG